MRWTKYHNNKLIKEPPNYGDYKTVKRFCFFPKSHYDPKTNSTTYYWLENVYITYEWTEGVDYTIDEWGIVQVERDYWKKINITTNSKENKTNDNSK